ncbi:MAG: uracil-DNA glycosylase [Burkholderiales bacterium]|nr:uracil-DNA glycosylase [Burkholderiales bacterium]
MSVPFCPGYNQEPFKSLAENYPAAELYPPKDFRIEWGPLFHRGRLDGTARLLAIGQDPAQHEAVARRILVGTAGKRAQGFVKRLGLTRSYVMINTYLYSVYGQTGGNAHIGDAGITAYRNQWIKAILDENPVEAVVGFGGLADKAWKAWLASPAAAGRPAMPYVHLMHPTWPESSSQSAAQHGAAIKKLLTNWNGGLNQLAPAIHHPDVQVPLALYGKKFTDADLPDIPPEDMPAGLPEWMRRDEGWADRKGRTAKEKRRTIVIVAPASEIPA